MTEKFTSEDLAGVVAGSLACYQALQKIWPEAEPADLLDKLEQLQSSPLALELLYMLLQDRKIKVA